MSMMWEKVGESGYFLMKNRVLFACNFLPIFNLYHFLGKFGRRQTATFFLFYSENTIKHFMRIVSQGDNLHKKINSVLRENKNKIF